MADLSETILKVGSKGEIFTNEELRKKARIKKGGRVRATVSDNKLIIEPVPSLEELVRNPVITLGIREAEKLSEEAQEEEGIYG